MPGEELGVLQAIPGAEGVWEAYYYDEGTHEETGAFVKRGCKGADLKARFEAAEEKYKAGEIGPCVYVERMIVFELPKGGGVCVYAAIPITDDLKASVNEKGGCKLIIVPTQEHAKYHGGWTEAYPEAVVVCCSGKDMEPHLAALGDRAKVCDFHTPAKWAKEAIKATTGISFEVMDWAGFQEIVMMHRKSKTLITSDNIYLGSEDKNNKAGWKNFPSEVWQELYFEAYCVKSPAYMPIYRTFLTPDQQKVVAKTLKKVLSWKAERVTSARCGKTSDGGAAEVVKIVEGHWGFCNAA